MSQYKDILSGLYNFLLYDLSNESLSKSIETKRLFFIQQLSSLGISSKQNLTPNDSVDNINFHKRHSLPVINNTNIINNNIVQYSGENTYNLSINENYNQETLKMDSKYHSRENIHEENIYETPIPSVHEHQRQSLSYDNQNNDESNINYSDDQTTISRNSALLLPRKSFLQTRRLSFNNNPNDSGWTLLGPLMHRAKHNKWIKMNTCLLLGNARLVAFKTYPVKSTIFISNANWTSSASLCIYLCGAHGLYAARDSGMNHVIKISAPGTNYETHVFATENEQQALIWTDQINQYGTGNVPSHSFSFLDKDLVNNFTTIPGSLHNSVTHIVSNECPVQLHQSQQSLVDLSHGVEIPQSLPTKTPNAVRRDQDMFTRRNACHNNMYDVGVFHNLDYNLDESQENISLVKFNQPISCTNGSQGDSKSQFNKRNSLLSSVRKKMEQQFPSKRRLSVQQFDNNVDLTLNSYQSSVIDHAKKSLTISSPSSQSSPKFSMQPLQQNKTHQNFSKSHQTTGLNWSQLSVGGHIFLRKSSYPHQSTLSPNSPFLGSISTLNHGNLSNSLVNSSNNNFSPSLSKKDGSLTPSVRIRTSLRRASLSAFKFNQSSSISDLSHRNNRSFDQPDEPPSPEFIRDPDELISGEAQICIPDQTPWTTRWCSLRNDYLNIYSSPAQPPPSQMNKPIFSLSLRHGLVYLELANDKRYRAAIKLSAPSLSNKCLYFHVADKIIIGAWIRGFIQALGMIKNDTTQRSHLNLSQLNGLTPKRTDPSTDLDSPVYSEIALPAKDDHCSNIRPFSMIETKYDTDQESFSKTPNKLDNYEAGGTTGRSSDGRRSSPVYDEVFHVQQTSLPIEIGSYMANIYDDNDDEEISKNTDAISELTMETPSKDQLLSTPNKINGLRKATSVEILPKRPAPAKSIIKRLNDAEEESFTKSSQNLGSSTHSVGKENLSIPAKCEIATNAPVIEDIYDEIAPPNSQVSNGITVGRSISCKCPVLDYGRKELAFVRDQIVNKCTSNTLPTVNRMSSSKGEEINPSHHNHLHFPIRNKKDPSKVHGPSSFTHNSNGHFYSTSTSSFYSSSLSSRTAASSGIPLNNSSLNQSENNTRPPSSSFGCTIQTSHEESNSPLKFNQNDSIYCNEDFLIQDSLSSTCQSEDLNCSMETPHGQCDTLGVMMATLQPLRNSFIPPEVNGDEDGVDTDYYGKTLYPMKHDNHLEPIKSQLLKSNNESISPSNNPTCNDGNLPLEYDYENLPSQSTMKNGYHDRLENYSQQTH